MRRSGRRTFVPGYAVQPASEMLRRSSDQGAGHGGSEEKVLGVGIILKYNRARALVDGRSRIVWLQGYGLYNLEP